MHPGTLKALEFDRVVVALRSLALTPLGEAELALTAPSADPAVVTDRLALTTEAVRLLTDAPGFPLRAPADLHDTIALLGVRDAPSSRSGSSASPRSSSRSSSAGTSSAGRRDRPSRGWRRSSPASPRSTAKSATSGAPSTRRANSSTTPAPRCAPSAIACASSASASAAPSSRTCGRATRPSTCRNRSSPTATADTS